MLAGHQITRNNKGQNDIDNPTDNGHTGIVDHRYDVGHHCLNRIDSIRQRIVDGVDDISKINIRVTFIQQIQIRHDRVIQRG